VPRQIPAKEVDMFTLPSEPGSIGHTLDVGFKLYIVSFKRVIVMSVLATMSIYVPIFFVVLLASGESVTGNSVLVALIPTVIVGVILYLMLYLAVLYRVGTIAQGLETSAGACMSYGFRRILPVIFAGLLYVLAMMGGMMLLLIPGIIVSISLAFYTLCILFDGDGAIESLRHSHRLVWGNWWRTVTLTSVIMIVYMVIYLAIGIPVSLIDGLVFESGTENGAFGMLGDAIASAVTFPLMASVFVAVYHDLKLRKEGHDLEARVEALTASA
jgi:hypothetical protein